MTPGGVLEIISYFAGAMHLEENALRIRDIYLDPALIEHVGRNFVGYGSDDHVAGPSVVWDSSPNHPIYFPPADEPIIGVRVPHHHYFLHFEPWDTNLPYPELVPPYPEAPQIQIGFGLGYTMESTSPEATPVHPTGVMVNTMQVNGLDAIEYLGVYQTNPLVQAYGSDAAGHIDQMMAQADALVPAGFGGLETTATFSGSLYTTNVDPLGLVNSYDAGLSAGTLPNGTVALGEYVNGVFDPNYTTPVPVATEPTIPGIPTNIMGEIHGGLSTYGGDNFQLNQAEVFDGNSQYSNMIVFGNYYSTNAIFQTNVLEDLNHIAASSPAGATSNISIAPDLLNNIASFSEQSYSLSAAPGSTSSVWNVSVVNGDFYDVNVVSQLNVMNAGGVSFQNELTSFYQAITGGNQQINGELVNSNGQPYDLIIVEGNYQNANLVYQNNIVFNQATVDALLGAGNGTSQSITAGGNALTNYAAILNYGGNEFAILSPQLEAAAQASENGQFQPTVANATEGNGSGALNVLFITGNFYDINIVSQTNILSDASLVMQSAGNGAAGTTATEAITTGANQALNLAQIIDVGAAGTQYVGGQIYTDSLLVQSNILTQMATALDVSPQTLANEIIAFIGNEPGNAVPSITDIPGTGSTSAHHDLLST